MATKVIVRGIGKAGRLFLKHSIEMADVYVDAIADDAACEHVDNLAYLLKYDTVHGVSNHQISASPNEIIIDGRKIPVIRYDDIPTSSVTKVNIIVDFTGNLSYDTALSLVDAGYRVIANNIFEDDIDNTVPVITTANMSLITSTQYNIISTNPDIESIAQVVKQINANFGMLSATLTFIKSATSAMSVDDTFVASGTYDAGRGCFENMIVTDNIAGMQLGKIIPELKNVKIAGNTIRVPSVSGFIAQIDATCDKLTEADEVNYYISNYISDTSSRTLAYCDDPISPTDTRSLFAPTFVSSKTRTMNNVSSTGQSIIRAYVFYHPENVSVEISTEIIRTLA